MVNNKIIEYQKTKDEQLFYKIYYLIHQGGKLANSFARRYRLDTSDVESIINDKLMSLIDTHDPSRGKFTSELYVAIKFGCIDLLRKKIAEDEFLEDVMIEDDEGEQNEVYEITEVAPTTSELETHSSYIIRSEQRQLIASLLEKADEPTKLTISAFLQSDSFREAAKQLGVCHKTVAARIRRISRNFNPKEFGNHYDYFLVPTA